MIVAQFVPRGVSVRMVLASVDLDNQPASQTNEIDDVPITRCLPSEMIAPHFP